MQKARHVVLAALMAVATAVPAAGQSLEQVLDGYYDAIGGVEAWEGLRTMRASGTLDVMGGMATGPFTIVQMRPAMFRLTIDIQGMRIVQAYDGATAWQVMPMMGITEPEVADAETAASIREQSDLDGPFIGWEEDGLTLALDGTEVIDGVETTKVRVTSPEGKIWDVYLGADHLPVRIVSTASVQGVTGQLTTKLGDYRDVGGMMFAYWIEVDTAMGSQTLTFDSIEVNVPVDRAIFSMAGG